METLLYPGTEGNPSTYRKLEETLHVIDSIIDNLPPSASADLLSGTGQDIDYLFNAIQEETYNVLFGPVNRRGTREIDFGYIDQLNNTIEETYRIENISYFITSTLPNFRLKWYHMEWGYFVMNGNKICLICSRDGGKSYYFSNAYPIWKMYRYRPESSEYLINRPDLAKSHRGTIIVNEMDLGIELLEILKDNIEGNETLKQRLFPEESRFWAQKAIKAKNGARLNIKSYNSQYRGRHPGYIVCDDYLAENVIYSVTQRKKSIERFHGVIMNALEKGGQICVVGTPMHAEDLYGKLKKLKSWTYLEYPAIFPDGRVLDPDRYSFNDLKEIREEQGSFLFSRERLVRPVTSDTTIFPYKFLRRAKVGMDKYKLVLSLDNFPKKFERVVVGVDLAISASAGADYSVYTVFGIDGNDHMWLLYIWRKKGASYGEQISVLKKIHKAFKVDLFCIESNQFQAVVGEEAEAFGLPVFLHHTGTNKYHFRNGLPALSLVFEKVTIHLPTGNDYSENVAELVISEFASIAWTDNGLEGVGSHDDVAMSVWKAYTAKNNIDNYILGLL